VIKTVYLSGRINGLTYEQAREFRYKAILLLSNVGIQCLDPMRGKKILEGTTITDTMSSLSERKIEMQEIIARDLDDIDRSDAIIVQTGDEPSWGTGMEAGYALAKRKPIFVISQKEERCGWLHFNAVKVYPTIEQLVEYIDKFWNART